MITNERLIECLHYSPADGLFTWIAKPSSRSNIKVGDKAGVKNKRGYIVIQIDNKKYKAHRLAWLYNYGKFPDGVIDHINRDTSDNRIENLRDVTQSINLKNRRLSSSNKSGKSGVYKQGNSWIAQINSEGVREYIGSFKTKEEATVARCNKEKEDNRWMRAN